MLVVNADRNIKVVDLASLKEVFALPESDPVTSICVSRTSAQVLVNIAAYNFANRKNIPTQSNKEKKTWRNLRGRGDPLEKTCDEAHVSQILES